MSWEQLQQIGDKFGWAIVAGVLLGFALHKKIFTLGRETEALEKELQRHREEMAAERERHRGECERMKELHRFEVQRWQDMAIQNNAIALRSQDIGSRATQAAEKLAEKVAQPSQPDQA
jgi:hypothetical protein